MTPVIGDRIKRWMILGPTSVLPHGLRVSLRRNGLAQLELARAKRAELIIIGHPKSGNTWLRTMLSRLFQVRFGLESNFVPSFLQVVDEIPKTASEKPQERILLQRFTPDGEGIFRAP